LARHRSSTTARWSHQQPTISGAYNSAADIHSERSFTLLDSARTETLRQANLGACTMNFILGVISFEKNLDTVTRTLKNVFVIHTPAAPVPLSPRPIKNLRDVGPR
jgi:hypothetical protein